jgi:hypothetical protein
VQVQASDDAFGSLAIISPADSASVAELSLRTVNVAKGPDGLGLSIKVGEAFHIYHMRGHLIRVEAMARITSRL